MLKKIAWPKVFIASALLAISGGLFFAAHVVQNPDDFGIETETKEFELYNECVTLIEEAEELKDLKKAHGKCLEVEEMPPNDSDVDARAKRKRAEILIILAMAETPVNYEILLEARAVFYEVLDILPPDSDMLKDVQINIEKLTITIENEMQEQLAEKGKSGEEIAELIDGALKFEGDGFSEDEPGDDRY